MTVPIFTSVAENKLNILLADGWWISGYSLQRDNDKALITNFGFVGWQSDQNSLPKNYRLCVLMLKYLLEDGKKEKPQEEIIGQLTEDSFERWFIPLATYWSNDIIDMCFNELGIEQPKDGSYTTEGREDWYNWFVKTVNELVLP